MSRRRRARRGQAVVELALGSLVFVTILLIGIYFGEVMVTSLKVTEAANAGLWDTTHYKMHSMGIGLYDNSPSSAAVANANAQANARYSDFDGRTSRAGPAMLTQVVTRSSALQVNCRHAGAPAFRGTPLTMVSYSDNPGISCQAQANIASINIPRSFDEGGNLFQARHWAARPLTICALGRARGGGCPSNYTMLLDDWGLAEGSENNNCPGIPFGIPCFGRNIPFYGAVVKSYGFSMGINGLLGNTAGSDLARAVVGASPLVPDERMFYMSYTGEELAFQQPIWPFPSDGWILWETTPFIFSLPFYGISYASRSGCYLGLNCNSPNGSAP